MIKDDDSLLKGVVDDDYDSFHNQKHEHDPRSQNAKFHKY